MNKVTIGADIEAFVFDKERKKIVSAIPLIQGTKDEPENLSYLGQGYAILHDNVTVEFNIPAALNVNEFYSSIHKIKKAIDQRLDPSRYLLTPIASHIMDKEELRHPDALLFGCEPDFNSWRREVNPKPCATDSNLRSAGAHIHFGYDNPTEETSINIVKAMDLHLGVVSVLLDKDTLRRQLYGKSGAYRLKEYGGEYRTLSNFWIKSSKLIKWAYKETKRSIDMTLDGFLLTDDEGEKITYAINNGCEKTAKELVNKYKLQLV